MISPEYSHIANEILLRLPARKEDAKTALQLLDSFTILPKPSWLSSALGYLLAQKAVNSTIGTPSVPAKYWRATTAAASAVYAEKSNKSPGQTQAQTHNEKSPAGAADLPAGQSISVGYGWHCDESADKSPLFFIKPNAANAPAADAIGISNESCDALFIKTNPQLDADFQLLAKQAKQHHGEFITGTLSTIDSPFKAAITNEQTLMIFGVACQPIELDALQTQELITFLNTQPGIKKIASDDVLKAPFGVYEDYAGGLHLSDDNQRTFLSDAFAYDPGITSQDRTVSALARMEKIAAALNAGWALV